MTFSKGDLMKLTRNDEGVDSAIPNYIVDEMKKLGFNEQDIIYAIAYSYNNNSTMGLPIILPLEFIKLLENTKIDIKDKNGELLNLGTNYTLADLIKSLLTGYDNWEIRLK
jgi:hypothetical protein